MPPEIENKILKNQSFDRYVRMITAIGMIISGIVWTSNKIEVAVNEIKMSMKDTSLSHEFYQYKTETDRRLNRYDSSQAEIINILKTRKK